MMVSPHDLLKLNRSPLPGDAPAWAHAALTRIPFAVVRRAVPAATPDLLSERLRMRKVPVHKGLVDDGHAGRRSIIGG